MGDVQNGDVQNGDVHDIAVGEAGIRLGQLLKLAGLACAIRRGSRWGATAGGRRGPGVCSFAAPRAMVTTARQLGGLNQRRSEIAKSSAQRRRCHGTEIPGGDPSYDRRTQASEPI